MDLYIRSLWNHRIPFPSRLNIQLSQGFGYLFHLITYPLIYGSGKAVNEDIIFAIQPQNVFKISTKIFTWSLMKTIPWGTTHSAAKLASVFTEQERWMDDFDFFLSVQIRSIRLAYPEVFTFICQCWKLNTWLCASREAQARRCKAELMWLERTTWYQKSRRRQTVN